MKSPLNGKYATASLGFALLVTTPPVARAASDITIAAIATGRLYVVDTTERPKTSVVLEGRFQAESDDKGKFQFEAVYHPARCIVSVQIEGRTYEAVVSNCGQEGSPCEPGTPKGAGTEEPKSVQVSPPGSPDSQGLSGSPGVAPTDATPPTPGRKKLAPPATNGQIKRAPAPPPRPKLPKKPQPR